MPNSRFPGDYRQIVSRSTYCDSYLRCYPKNFLLTHSRTVPAKLDPSLMKEPRANQGAPRIPKARTTRKPIPSMLGLAMDMASLGNSENEDPLGYRDQDME